ncbi:Hsp70 family protein [Dactylosporangium sp. NPDC049140]|uniref:Hsp70 family protein n=1 Tax=Dactylosporangium sp. NPDC049140 TaxID=3155647 RepID=UPI00340F4243
MDAARIRLGIDFGTSNTVAALAGPDGRIRALVVDGSPLVPSAVFAAGEAEPLVGVDAVRAAAGNPAAFEGNPKRRIDDGTVWLGERDRPVVELIAAVLARVAGEARRVAGGAAGETVLTHPATWGGPRLAVLAEAAARAGLPAVRFVPEPVAATAYFVSVLGDPIPPGRAIVVYDLGAGTFDVSVVCRTATGFNVLAADGLPDAGGLDLDAALLAHLRTATAEAPGGATAAAWRRLDWPETEADHRARRMLWHDAKAAKEQLSRHSTATLDLPVVGGPVHVTREEFEAVAGPVLARTVALTRAVLQRAAVPPEQVARVFLVGGSSRIPLAATLLHRALGIAPTVIDQPELVVAEGALHARPSVVQPSAPLPAPPVPPAPVPLPDSVAQGSGRVWWAAVAVVIALAVAIVSVVSWKTLAAGSGSPAGNGAASPAASPAASAAASLVRASASAAGGLPAGWRLHDDPSGFEVAVPGNLSVTQTGTRLLFAEPSRTMFLIVDQTTTPKADPYTDFLDKVKARNMRCADGFDGGGYQEIGINRVEYSPPHRNGTRPAAPAADWEYTCALGGARFHVRYRNFVTGPHHAYAVIWMTATIAWDGLRSSLDTVLSSFTAADD